MDKSHHCVFLEDVIGNGFACLTPLGILVLYDLWRESGCPATWTEDSDEFWTVMAEMGVNSAASETLLPSGTDASGPGDESPSKG